VDGVHYRERVVRPSTIKDRVSKLMRQGLFVGDGR